MFVTRQEFETHLYEEIQNKISRNDQAKIEQALLTAQQIVARYLTAYDTATIFATEGTDRAPYGELTLYIKDIAKWHFIAVANVSVDLELAQTRYDNAISALKDIQKSFIIPTWPLAQDNTAPAPFVVGSQPRKSWNF